MEVTNIGHIRGAEVIGIYTGKSRSLLYGPRKELRAFKKVYLDPGEKQKINIFLPTESLKAYCPVKQEWVLENVNYNVYVGINVQTTDEIFQILVDDANDLSYLKNYQKENEMYYRRADFNPSIKDFTTLFGESLPLFFANRKRPFTLANNISDTTDYWWGRTIYKIMAKTSRKLAGDDVVLQEMAVETIKELPFRSLSALSSGEVSTNQRDAILLLVNGKPIRGIFKFLRKKK